MSRENSISIVISALNEEDNLRPTIALVESVIAKEFDEYELIIVDDGSGDRTAEIAASIAANAGNVAVIHHKTPQGLGAVYKEGLRRAKCYYYLLITGDNEATRQQIERIIGLRGKADMVIPYTENSRIRPLSRRLLSKTFVGILNLLFGLRLRYYNGLVLHKRHILQSIDITTDSFAYQAEALIKLIKAGFTYVEVGIEITRRGPGGSKALRPRNILQTIQALFSIYYQIYLTKNRKRRNSDA